ncbi:hypothetical protein CHU98_g12284 [Xylaria longipes]|nr:hypothetical protein CHU98_g12284 [Xylaria longipes]
MDIQNFLNPAEEAIKDSPEDLEEQILAQFYPEGEEDSQDEDPQPERLITVDEAIRSLQQLCLFEEQTGGHTDLIISSNKNERSLWLRK